MMGDVADCEQIDANRADDGAAIKKFSDPGFTAKGEVRAIVSPIGFRTLWFNTGTLCNLACKGCYIESSPRNDRLAYLTREDARAFLAEAKRDHKTISEIGFTGGEPFMNPDFIGMLGDALHAGYRVLVLTNAMAPMRHKRDALLDLRRRYPAQLTVRVSLDHFTKALHEAVRGNRSWEPAMDGLKWLSDHGFNISVAARIPDAQSEEEFRAGYATLFADRDIRIDAQDKQRMVLFPDMDASHDVAEITEHCWGILGKNPDDIMCATSRMVVRHKGDDAPSVVSCTLLPYDAQFHMGRTLGEANRPVALNHPYCAQFCVLGGASCSAS